MRAWALDSDLELAQVSHRQWVSADRAPSFVVDFSQDAAGQLWLATAAGPYSFDGVIFTIRGSTHAALPSNQTAILVADDDTHWGGYRTGGASVIRSRQTTHFGERDGLQDGAVHDIVQDSKRVIWLASDDGLFRFEGERWRPVSLGNDAPPGPVLSIRVARDDTLWVVTPAGVFSLAGEGQRVVKLVSERFDTNTPTSLAQAPDGALWVSQSPRGVLRFVPGSAEPARWWFKGQAVGPLLFDRDGSLWIGGDRLRRMTLAQSAAGPERSAHDQLSLADGLSGTQVLSLFEDRSGAVWAGTERGVDRFRHADVAWVVEPRVGQNKVIVAGGGTRTWVADRDGSLFAFDGRNFAMRLPAPRFTAGFRDRQGAVWFGGPEGIARVVDDRRLEITALPPGARGHEVQAMTRDADGALWVSVDRVGLFRLLRQQWTEHPNPALPREAPLVAASDDSGVVWLGYTDNRLARISGDSIQLFTAANGIDVGTVTALHARASRLWVGGDVGLGLFDGMRHQGLLPRSCQPFSAVSGIVETASGDLWIFRRNALSRIRQIDQVLQQLTSQDRVPCESFGTHELPAPTPQQLRPLPSLIAAGDGRLWLAAYEGLAWLDPGRIGTESLAPPRAYIGYIITYEGGTDCWRPCTLPVHTRDLMFRFGAISTASPEWVRFKYKLEGQDEQWTRTLRHEANYTNLSPGTYRFQVAASNWDAEAGEPISIEFNIPPAFYQTTWFRALCVLAALFLLAWFVRIQVRRANARLRARMEDRMRERERIARELHDTLLQGIQALVLRFQGVAARIPANEPARDMMERALDLADDVISEGRDRVNDLRDSNSSPENLIQQIARVGKEILEESPVGFAVTVHGKPRALHPIVREEAFLIAREALANAHRHARPRTVEVTVFYERPALRISIRDDGLGIDDEVLHAGGREKHWGLRGMRERATRIRGRVEIWSRAGAGTEIELRVPASMAYRSGGSPWQWFADLIGWRKAS